MTVISSTSTGRADTDPLGEDQVHQQRLDPASVVCSGNTGTDNQCTGARGEVDTSPQNRAQKSGVARFKEVSNACDELNGTRCRATKEIRSHQGLAEDTARASFSTDIDNLGRHLISVQWDNGVSDHVYPLDIEILSQGYEPAFIVLMKL